MSDDRGVVGHALRCELRMQMLLRLVSDLSPSFSNRTSALSAGLTRSLRFGIAVEN